MTEDQEWMKIKNTKNVQNHTFKRISEGFDFEKCSPYIDKIKTLFVPSLENRIYSGLEEFVYTENANPESELSYLKKCINLATSLSDPLDALCERYKNVHVLEEATKHFINYGIKDGLVTSFIDSVVLNNRLNRICRELDSLRVEKNLLSYENVWNFITEKDYWMGSDNATSANSPITVIPVKDIGSDLDVETGSGMADMRQEERRAPKRSATYESSSNFKLEDDNEDSLNYFEVNEDLLSSLKNGSNIFSGLSFDERHDKRRRNGCAKSSCPKYRRKHSKIDWNEESLKLQIIKMYSKNCKKMTFGKSKRSTRLSLPCKYEDLLGKIIKEDSSLSIFDFSKARQKFENGIYNVVSCLNNVIGRLDRSRIKELCLFCEIRQDYIKLKLKPRYPGRTNVCLFAARVATYKELFKRTRTRDNKKLISAENTKTEATEIREDLTPTVQETDDSLKYNLLEVKLVECDSQCGCPSKDPPLSQPFDEILHKEAEHPSKYEQEDEYGSMIHDISNLRSSDVDETQNRLRSTSVQTLVSKMSTRCINIDLVPKESAISLESNITRIISFTDPPIRRTAKDSMNSVKVSHEEIKCREVKSFESLDGLVNPEELFEDITIGKPSINQEELNDSGKTLNSYGFYAGDNDRIQGNSGYKKFNVDTRLEKSSSKISFINKDISKLHINSLAFNSSANLEKSIKLQSSKKSSRTKNNICYCRDTKSRNKQIYNDKSEFNSNGTTIEKFIKASNFRNAFSTRSIDKIKHLIRTKICRKLLERDKSTNTSKTLLSNDKNYKSTSDERTSRLSRSTKSHSKSQKSLSTSWDKSNRNIDSSHQLPDYSSRLAAGSDDSPAVNKKSQVKKNQSIRKSTRRENTTTLFEIETQKKNYSEQIKFDRPNYPSRCSCYYCQQCNCDRNNCFNFTCHSECNTKSHSPYTSSRQVLLPQDTNDSWYIKDACRSFQDDYYYGYGVPYYPLNFLCQSHNKENTVEKNDSISKTDPDFCKGTGYRAYLEINEDIRHSHYSNRPDRFDGCQKESKNSWPLKSSSSKRNLDDLEQNFKISLSRYLSLCRNVKYSLLKRYKPDDIYEVSRTSIPCRDKQIRQS